jgi:hypothetical protein
MTASTGSSSNEPQHLSTGQQEQGINNMNNRPADRVLGHPASALAANTMPSTVFQGHPQPPVHADSSLGINPYQQGAGMNVSYGNTLLQYAAAPPPQQQQQRPQQPYDPALLPSGLPPSAPAANTTPSTVLQGQPQPLTYANGTTDTHPGQQGATMNPPASNTPMQYAALPHQQQQQPPPLPPQQQAPTPPAPLRFKTMGAFLNETQARRIPADLETTAVFSCTNTTTGQASTLPVGPIIHLIQVQPGPHGPRGRVCDFTTGTPAVSYQASEGNLKAHTTPQVHVLAHLLSGSKFTSQRNTCLLPRPAPKLGKWCKKIKTDIPAREYGVEDVKRMRYSAKLFTMSGEVVQIP